MATKTAPTKHHQPPPKPQPKPHQPPPRAETKPKEPIAPSKPSQPQKKKDDGKGDLYHHPDAPMKEGEIEPEHSSGVTPEEKLKKDQEAQQQQPKKL